MKALLVEDHPLFRDGFQAMLKHHRPNWVLDTAGSAGDALRALEANGAPDLAIIDIQLPDIDGFEAARAIAARAPLTPRVMISGREDEAARMRSHDCGASGFIAKAWPAERIIQMLEQVLQGGLAFDAGEAPRPGAGLTGRQLEVLSLLAEGCSNKAIERRLDIAPRTVRAHLTEIFHLLEASGRVQAILRARDLGLVA